MSGYRRQAYKLKWPDNSRWAGLEVRIRGMVIGELEEISKLRGNDASNIEVVGPVLDILGNALISWNFEDEDGVPVPIKDFRNEDVVMLMAIVSAWTEVVGDVPAPLPTNSSDGGKSEEALIPMEIPSSSHPNLSTPS